MPPRKSTASIDATPHPPPGEHPTPASGDLSNFSLPPDTNNGDISMLSTTSITDPAPSTPTTKPSSSLSKQKDKDTAPGSGEHAAGDKDAATTPGGSSKDKEKEKDGVGIDDLLLPRTLLSRLARGVLPPNTSISKDALLALTKAASVFISHLSSTADELTTKKTIAPQEVLSALEEIEWGHLQGKCEGELKIWEDVTRGKRKGYRDRVKARESGVSAVSNTSEAVQGEGSGGKGDEEDGGERAGKRPRVDPSSSEPQHIANGTHKPHGVNGVGMDDHDNDATEPEDEEEAEDQGHEEGPGDEESSEEEDEDEQAEDGEDGYGPEDQLRHDILNGDGGGGIDDDDDREEGDSD